ncbi:DUF465 domain-containing protein [Sulfurimonas sp. CVO]|jgi:hypothetical protein|uniref:DUF465 domain-containing protein n=1 Tax=Sulfurimonas xiamenensis TaxID=2590021 RepID=A0AAJ4A3C8_9BACT|nr:MULTISPECIES: DUF465 domain-containing protein [Sulfurimonas]PLY15353.1 MAG: hypothetical protein C0628_02855 [Sulfurimonas sp.]QFR43127.1 DUF465 domain-containing protein [Sulfurimonas xiamenensis]QHG91328.1 DUF465 domain-containing protein [Sulfurimonas sp. CVO]
MLHEYRDVITHMKENGKEHAHFLRIFNKHNEIDDKITKGENGDVPLTDMELETLKKEKLKLKDEAYAILLQHKKEHNL